MAKKMTVAELHALVVTLTERLDKAAHVVGAQAKRIQELETHAEKARKQFWYLQRVADGRIDPHSKPANGEDAAPTPDLDF